MTEKAWAISQPGEHLPGLPVCAWSQQGSKQQVAGMLHSTSVQIIQDALRTTHPCFL